MGHPCRATKFAWLWDPEPWQDFPGGEGRCPFIQGLPGRCAWSRLQDSKRGYRAGLGWGRWAGVSQRGLAMGSFRGCHPRPGPLLDHELVSFRVQMGTQDPLSLELVSTGWKSGQVFRLEETIWLTFGRCAASGTRDGTGSTVALRAGQRSLWARLSIRVLKE